MTLAGVTSNGWFDLGIARSETTKQEKRSEISLLFLRADGIILLISMFLLYLCNFYLNLLFWETVAVGFNFVKPQVAAPKIDL